MEHLSLYDLNAKIKDCLKNNLEESYWVVAEIAEIRINQKGHCYLEMVEKTGDEIIAKNRATIWSYTYRNLSGWFEALTGQSLKPGLKILCNIGVSHHEVYGLSLNIKDIDAGYTIGERAKKRLEILKKLEDDGILEMNKQLPLPLVPQRVAVIASSTSAGYLDFLSQLKQYPSHYKFNIEHYQAIMQGAEAEKSIIEALHEVHKNIDDYDLLVIIRGGGATLDLECFDTYELASHVAQYPIPIVTGIGHERDETITDIVANTSLKTPTAVAEFLISGCREFEEQLDSLFLKIVNRVEHTFQGKNNQLDYLIKHLKYISDNIVKSESLKLMVLSGNIKNAVNGRKQVLETILSGYTGSIKFNSERYLAVLKKDLMNLSDRIILADPKRVLKRGYTITRHHHKILKSARGIKQGDIIEIEFYDGKKESKISK
jgi:exodeoxyribonuclease VII large subunit